tara:strand:+ start:783 stop:1553 length:771 start_codon:yes stop_codon:yes gene_type:complete
MEIIPAIDLLKGKCVRLNQGNYNKVTQFNNDPVTQAIEWQRLGATRIHLVDLDGAKTGLPINDSAIKSIKSVLDIPLQIGGGIRTIERAEELLNYGLDKVILGTIAIEEPNLMKKLVDRNPGKIIIGIDAKDGKVATRGWISQTETKATDLAKRISSLDIASIISTDISTDGTLQGPNISALEEMALASHKPVIASGGVGTMADLLSLLTIENIGISGVIVGRALYEGTIDLKEAIERISQPIVNDFPIKKNEFYA